MTTVTETTTFECGCVVHWQVKQGQPTPLTCPIHRAIWERTDSEPVVPQAELDRLRAVGEAREVELYEALKFYADRHHDPVLNPTLDEFEDGKTARDALKSYREAVPELDLQADLLALFARHGVSVGVGRTQKGVAIRSQDERVDARNIGPLEPLAVPEREETK